MRLPSVTGTALALVLAVALAGCGRDDDAGQAAAPTAAGTPTAAAERVCAPVGEDLEARAGETVEVQLTDYAFVPDHVEVDAGVITFATENDGTEPHELAFLPGGGDVPFTEDGAPDEEALEAAGAFELEAYSPGQGCHATYDLEPGSYTLFCIVGSPDGDTHYQKGMRGTLVAR